jgi:hypothetical protein
MSQKKLLLPVNEFLARLGAIVSLLVPGRAAFHLPTVAHKIHDTKD